MTVEAHEPRRWSRVAAWVAVGVVGGGVTAGVVVSQLGVAAANNAAPAQVRYQPGAAAMGGMMAGGMPARGWRGPDGRGPGGGPHMMGHMMGRLLGIGPGAKVLHGEVTLGTPDGKTKLVQFQIGTVSSVSGSSVTVTSTDGFAATYTTDGDTKVRKNGAKSSVSALASGDAVRLVAVKTGSDLLAKGILDGKTPGLDRMRAWMRHHHPDRPAPQATPSGAAGT